MRNFSASKLFHAESGCAGMLFNDPFRPPLVALDKSAGRDVAGVVRRMLREQQARSLAFDEMLLAQLKMLLIVATRLRAGGSEHCEVRRRDQRHPVCEHSTKGNRSHNQLHAMLSTI